MTFRLDINDEIDERQVLPTQSLDDKVGKIAQIIKVEELAEDTQDAKVWIELILGRQMANIAYSSRDMRYLKCHYDVDTSQELVGKVTIAVMGRPNENLGMSSEKAEFYNRFCGLLPISGTF